MGQRGTKQPEVRVLLLGLDNAGKSTLLYKLKHGSSFSTVPTIGFNVEMLDVKKRRKNIALTVWDVGGQAQMRRHWRGFHQDTAAVVFVVDSADRQRVEEARRELESTLKSEHLRGRPVLVLANKQDIGGAMTVTDIKDAFHLKKICGDREWFVQACSAYMGNGVDDALRRVSHMVKLPSESAATVKENFKDTVDYIKAKSLRR
ncbi:ADP-ribosylation factor-like protein 14 [Dunckerocampus dactyliophorus]|uniref:ADP-ribosylation factor-like protein 14 n=1 Tax=Dunckerocampus dactyliophorus TaxID=161453 RepID=UPI0024062FA9|nr:ADP-ribosylation factor-like protein 14 [Dunckerocampus dactyliophorus]